VTGAAATAKGSVAGGVPAVGAFLMWGLFPAYFKLLGDVPALEVLAHRIIWSMAFAGILLSLRGGWQALGAIFSDRRHLAALAGSAIAIACNWGVFIWAVNADRVLDSSLGYYITPLVSVLLAFAVLRERLSRAQAVAVGLAAIGVAILIGVEGIVPWVALALAATFGTYGLIRKVVAVGPIAGLLVETVLLAPVAVAYLAWLHASGEAVFGADVGSSALLVSTGIVTGLPLVLFVAGAQRVRLITLGLLQYIVPTGHFLLAVVVFGEPLTPARIVTFICIWAALAVYTYDSVRNRRRSEVETP